MWYPLYSTLILFNILQSLHQIQVMANHLSFKLVFLFMFIASTASKGKDKDKDKSTDHTPSCTTKADCVAAKFSCHSDTTAITCRKKKSGSGLCVCPVGKAEHMVN